MSSSTFQLSKLAAQSYEGQKVKAIFRPMAEATVEKMELTENDKILDVACGTGIIARVIGERIPSVSRLVGSDLNESMLEVAKDLTERTSYLPEWHQGEVSNLPFESNSFSKCFCQQGLQYFPEKVAALRDKDLISGLIAEAGFKDQTMQVITANRILGVADKSIPSEIDGISGGKEVTSKGPEIQLPFVHDIAEPQV